MFSRLAITVVLSATVSIFGGIIDTVVPNRPSAVVKEVTTTTTIAPTTTTAPKPVDWVQVEFFAQMQDPRTPSLAYWARLAECETQGDWQDKGQWGGGLGIFTRGAFRDDNMGTWERWGGEEFAKHPSGATVLEQVVIANRIALFGYETTVQRDPERAKIQGVPATYVWKRSGVGFGGWGCAHHIGFPPKKRT